MHCLGNKYINILCIFFIFHLSTVDHLLVSILFGERSYLSAILSLARKAIPDLARDHRIIELFTLKGPLKAI